MDLVAFNRMITYLSLFGLGLAFKSEGYELSNSGNELTQKLSKYVEDRLISKQE